MCIYGSAPFVIVSPNITGRSKSMTGFKNVDGDMEGTWKEYDGMNRQTDDYKNLK